MARYIDSNIIPGEEVIRFARPTWWSAFWPLFWCVLLAPFTAGVSLLFIIPTVLRILTTEIVITNKRLVIKTGLISRDITELSLQKIEALAVNQTVTGRVLKFGNLTAFGGGQKQGYVKGVANAMAFRSDFYQAQNTAYIQEVRIVS